MFRTALKYGTAAGLLVTGLLAVPAAAAAATPVPNLPPEVLAEYVEQYADVPRETLYARIALNAPRKKLLERFATERAATFGGSWYDYREGVWHVLATNDAAAAAMAKDARAIGVTTRTRVVRHSYAALEAKADRIRNGRDPLSASAGNRVGLDVQANRVTVVAARSNAFVPSDPMVTFVGTPANRATWTACNDRRNCGVPMRSGIILWRGNYEAPEVTLGFTARAGDGSQWAYTAGHATGPTVAATWGHGQVAIGQGRQCGTPDPGEFPQCLNSPAVDILRIRISSSYWLSQGFGYLFHSPAQVAGISNAIVHASWVEVGDVVCLSGWHANYTGFPANDPRGWGVVSTDTCGVVDATADPAEFGMPRIRDVSVCRGDSGGGWFWYPGNGERWAYGTQSRADLNNNTLMCSGGRPAWFSTLPAINAFFDANTDSDIRVNTL